MPQSLCRNELNPSSVVTEVHWGRLGVGETAEPEPDRLPGGLLPSFGLIEPLLSCFQLHPRPELGVCRGGAGFERWVCRGNAGIMGWSRPWFVSGVSHVRCSSLAQLEP